MAEQSTAVGVRDRGKDQFDAGDFSDAEATFAAAHQQWPNRLDLAMWQVRCVDKQGRGDDRRSLLDDIVARHATLPDWATRELRGHGYITHRGVTLCLDHPVISEWMRNRMLKGDYEEIEADLLAEIVAPGERILEVGGGLGFMASFASLQAADVSAVVYEANPGLVPVAEHTKRLNGADFDFRNAMLGAVTGTAEFHVHEAFWASSASHQSSDSTTIQVPVHAVNKVLQEQAFTMLVMDIEGGEIDLIPEMDLTTVTRIVIETHPDVTGARSVRKMLRQLKKDFGFAEKQEREAVYLLARSS